MNVCGMLTLRQRAELQMGEDRLCMPLRVFYEALEHGDLVAELEGSRPSSDLSQILGLIPTKMGRGRPRQP